MKLIDGERYQNMISLVSYTLYYDGNGLWHIENEVNKGESCSEKEMTKLLSGRFKPLKWAFHWYENLGAEWKFKCYYRMWNKFSERNSDIV